MKKWRYGNVFIVHVFEIWNKITKQFYKSFILQNNHFIYKILQLYLQNIFLMVHLNSLQ